MQKWLYNNQMTISQVVIFFKRHNIVYTKTMIQHYMRINLLPPPLEKRYYTHEHLQMLFIIDYLKSVYALDEIKEMFVISNMPISQTYERFVQLKEGAELAHTDILTLMCKSVSLKKTAQALLQTE